jgi:single-stranded-DNA-specific exonuclease
MLDARRGMVEYAFDLNAATPVSPPRVASSPPDRPTRGRKRWRLRTSPLRGRLEHSGLPPLVALVLENRGVGSNAEAQLFLGGRETPLSSGIDLPGFDPALRLLRNAIKDETLVSVYGDFDVDGITSTAMLTETLRDLGGRVLPYIPHREREGYGLNKRAIDSLADRGAGLIVTCDCGTTSIDEIEHAHSLGVEVIVVDHHVPPAQLPDAGALLNPKLGDDHAPGSVADFSTGGVAYRLAEALYDDAHRPFPAARALELATLSTIADMVPLLGENRELVRRGLAAIGETQRPGLRALIEVSNLKPKDVTSEAVGFQLAPRINAAGRLADAKLALEMLLTEDEAQAMELAQAIDALNKQRQQMTLEAQNRAREKLEARPDAPITVVGDEAFHQGIIGLVASRLVELTGRPAAVYQKGPSESRGSCRSIPVYDITAGLRHCGDLFERYGGHHQAGGFTIRNDNLEALEQRLTEHAGVALLGHDLAPSIDIDAEWSLNALRSQEIRWLGKLQPYGMGNPEAVLLSRDVLVAEARGVGEGSKHLRLKLRSGNVVWPAICFGWEGECPPEGSRVDVVYSLSSDRYGPSGEGGALQLMVQDLAVTG